MGVAEEDILPLPCPHPGFNPCWGQTLQFLLRAPDLALVRFVVEDYDTASRNDFVGQFTLPLSSLKQGGAGRGVGSLSPDACLTQAGAGAEGLMPSCPRQGTATSTCFPRTGPHCLPPHSSSTSTCSTPEG